MKRKYLLIISSLILIVAVVFIPLLFIKNNFTAISFGLMLARTIISAITLIFAIILFDKYGLNKTIRAKQYDITMELVKILRESSFEINNFNHVGYLMYFRGDQINWTNQIKIYYSKDKDKLLLANMDDFGKIFNPILEYIHNDLMPNNIKNKLKPFDFLAFAKLENQAIDTQQYVLIQKHSSNINSDISRFGLLIPNITFEQFNINIQNLVLEIEKWIKKHTGEEIKIIKKVKI